MRLPPLDTKRSTADTQVAPTEVAPTGTPNRQQVETPNKQRGGERGGQSTAPPISEPGPVFVAGPLLTVRRAGQDSQGGGVNSVPPPKLPQT